MCRKRNETISHTVSECGKLAQKKYKRRHDRVGRYVHWQFCENLGFNRARLWCERELEGVVENENFMGFHHTVWLLDRSEKTRYCGNWWSKKRDSDYVCDKEREKIEKYRLWQMKKVAVIPIVAGTLGAITAKFVEYIESIWIEIRIEHVQKSASLGTARIIKQITASFFISLNPSHANCSLT